MSGVGRETGIRMRPGNVPPKKPGNGELTPAQADFFSHMFEETAKNGYQPSIRDLIEHYGFAAPNSVMCYIRALRTKGYLGQGKGVARQQGGLARCYRFLKRPDGGPFLGFRAITHEET